MDQSLPDVAVAFGQAAQRALDDAGGVDLARDAEVDPGLRGGLVARVLDGLGLSDLDVTASEEDLTAAAEVCRIAGRVALPYPVASRLAAAVHPEGRPLAVVDAERPWIDHADLLGAWSVVDLEGRTHRAEPTGAPAHKLAPFACRVQLSTDGEADLGRPQAALVLSLESWRLLGAVERALELAARHVTEREQFGRPLARFQAVQFHIADLVVAVNGLRQLARFTLWRLRSAPEDAWVDALALRVGALDAADLVFNTAHQLLGALGFCDEHDLSIVTRVAQSAVRLPTSLAHTTDLLAAAIDRTGFHSLFDPRTSSPALAS